MGTCSTASRTGVRLAHRLDLALKPAQLTTKVCHLSGRSRGGGPATPSSCSSASSTASRYGRAPGPRTAGPSATSPRTSRRDDVPRIRAGSSDTTAAAPGSAGTGGRRVRTQRATEA